MITTVTLAVLPFLQVVHHHDVVRVSFKFPDTVTRTQMIQALLGLGLGPGPGVTVDIFSR